MSTAPDSGQLMVLLLKMLRPKKTIEIGVFTGYSLLLTALSIPDDAKVSFLSSIRLFIFFKFDHFVLESTNNQLQTH